MTGPQGTRAMDTLQYTMIIEPARDKKGAYFCAFFPDLPGCTTMGATMDELRENAVEAVAGHIEALKRLGKPVPQPNVWATTVNIKAS